MGNLRGKRLLLLSGGMWKEAIKQHAEEEGIVLLATGNDSGSGIFEIAEGRYSVDSTDVSAMKKLICEAGVEGVYLGGCEPVIGKAVDYLAELGLPCYSTKEQWGVLHDKARFKDLLVAFGLPVAPRYDCWGPEEAVTAVGDAYPVITKPADGAGSSGFSVCRTPDELRVGYSRAEEASDSGAVVVEKFVKNDSVVVFFTFVNGHAIFSGLQDKWPVRYDQQGSYVAGLHVFPSVSTEDFRARFEGKLVAMFDSIGLRQGTLWIEVFHDGNDYYFNEAGYRYGGSMSMFPIDYFTGMNQVAMDMDFALTGKASADSGSSLIPSLLPRKSRYCMYPVHMRPGAIARIDGVDELLSRPEVVVIPLTKRAGQMVSATGTVGQVCMFVHFVFDTADELEAMIDVIHSTLSVTDDDGRELLVRKLPRGAYGERIYR